MEDAGKPEQIDAMRAELKHKSTEELFAATLEGDWDDDAQWEAVAVLHRRATPEVFEAAKEYCLRDDPRAQARGLGVLAQLGAGKPDAERPFLAESVSIAISHLGDSPAEVVTSAAWALSHLGTESAVTALAGLRSHPDPEVRQAVACCTELGRHPEATRILITLMEDANDTVRDWATFALASFPEIVDGAERDRRSAEVRAALHRRLGDPYEQARREGLWGLAKRKDPLGLKLLLGELESETRWSGDETAAEEILDVESNTPVEELRRGLRRLLAEVEEQG